MQPTNPKSTTSAPTVPTAAVLDQVRDVRAKIVAAARQTYLRFLRRIADGEELKETEIPELSNAMTAAGIDGGEFEKHRQLIERKTSAVAGAAENARARAKYKDASKRLELLEKGELAAALEKRDGLKKEMEEALNQVQFTSSDTGNAESLTAAVDSLFGN